MQNISNEKNINIEQVAAPALNTTSTQNAAEATPECSKNSSNPKRSVIPSTLSRELRAMIIESELLVIRKYNTVSGGMNKELSQSSFAECFNMNSYRKLLTKDNKVNVDAPSPLILKTAVACLDLCVNLKHDKMFNNLFMRNICEGEYALKEVLTVKNCNVNLSNLLGDFTQTHYEYLKKLYPNAKGKAELAKLAFSDVIMFAARLSGKFDTHLSSAGSKKRAMNFFHLDMLKFVDGEKKILIDVFSRTASIALASMGIFDEIYCGDKDKRFVNFFEVLRDYPVALVLRLKSICANYHNELLKLWYYEGEPYNFCNAFYKELIKRANKDLHKASLKVKIDAAVCLLLCLRFSFSGYEKDFNLTQASKFINNLDNICNDLIYTSMVLTDRNNSRKIKRGIYKKTLQGLAYTAVDEDGKNTIAITPVSYEHWSFMRIIKRYLNNPNALIILDPPYLRAFLLFCGDYKNKFTEEHMCQLLRLFRGAKCKVILFHSAGVDFESLAVRYGFRLVGTYAKSKDQKEVTQVFSLNISPDEKFFDPKNLGKLYDTSANSATDTIISSDKGVL